MVRLGCVPEQGGHPLIWKMPRRPGRRRRGRQEQTDDLGKMVPKQRPSEATTVPAGIRLWSWTEGADDWREQVVRMLEQLKSSIRVLCSIWRRRGRR